MHSTLFGARNIVFAGLFAATAATLVAQVQFVTVEYRQHNQQTGPSSVLADAITPYDFQAEVDGSNLTLSSPLTGATITYGSTTQNLSFNSGSGNWRYQSGAYSTLNNLLAAFPTGTYTAALTGTPNGSTDITLSDPITTLVNAPVMTFTSAGGFWSGNAFYFNPAATLTITFNAVFSGTPGATQGYNYNVDFNGPNSNTLTLPNGFSHYDPTSSAAAPDAVPSFVISAGTLVAGNSYVLQATYEEIQTFNLNALGSVSTAGLVGRSTFVNLVAVPEPGASAALLALGALGLARWRRRAR